MYSVSSLVSASPIHRMPVCNASCTQTASPNAYPEQGPDFAESSAQSNDNIVDQCPTAAQQRVQDCRGGANEKNSPLVYPALQSFRHDPYSMRRLSRGIKSDLDASIPFVPAITLSSVGLLAGADARRRSSRRSPAAFQQQYSSRRRSNLVQAERSMARRPGQRKTSIRQSCMCNQDDSRPTQNPCKCMRTHCL
jgi:hypothetical protein